MTRQQRAVSHILVTDDDPSTVISEVTPRRILDGDAEIIKIMICWLEWIAKSVSSNIERSLFNDDAVCISIA